MLGFTLVASLVTGILFGRALQAARVDINEALKQSGGRSGSSSGQGRLRNTLAVAEIALALLLLIGAGLLVKTFVRLRTLDLGIRTDNVLTMRTHIPGSKYGELAKRSAFYQGVLGGFALLVIISAGYGTAVPLTWRGGLVHHQNNGNCPGAGREYQAGQPRMDGNTRVRPCARADSLMTMTDPNRNVVIINGHGKQYWRRASSASRWCGATTADVRGARLSGRRRRQGDETQGAAQGEMFFPYTQIPQFRGMRPGL
jgi:hypothetical protein